MSIPGGKIAFITGASGNLGSEVVRVLNNAGVTTVAAYRTHPSRNLEGVASRQVRCDVLDERSVADAFREAGSEGKGPHIVVHCAGGFASDGSVEETSVATWNSMLNLNLTSSFLVVREALRTFGKAPYGRIVLISAFSAFAPGRGAVAYKVSKAALRPLLETSHAERGSVGVTINALAPRVIDSPQNRKDMPDADHSAWVTPRDLAESVAYLCSEAGGAVSGSIIPFP